MSVPINYALHLLSIDRVTGQTETLVIPDSTTVVSERFVDGEYPFVQVLTRTEHYE